MEFIVGVLVGAITMYIYHNSVSAKLAAVKAEIKQLEVEGVDVEKHVVARIKSLL